MLVLCNVLTFVNDSLLGVCVVYVCVSVLWVEIVLTPALVLVLTVDLARVAIDAATRPESKAVQVCSNCSMCFH